MDISKMLELPNWCFLVKRQLYYLSEDGCTCIGASEESLFCGSSVMFLPQITVAILNFAQRQRATQKMYNGYLHLLQAQVDPRSTLCNWLFNRKFKNENSQSLKWPDKCIQSEMVEPLSPQNENKVG